MQPFLDDKRTPELLRDMGLTKDNIHNMTPETIAKWDNNRFDDRLQTFYRAFIQPILTKYPDVKISNYGWGSSSATICRNIIPSKAFYQQEVYADGNPSVYMRMLAKHLNKCINIDQALMEKSSHWVTYPNWAPWSKQTTAELWYMAARNARQIGFWNPSIFTDPPNSVESPLVMKDDYGVKFVNQTMKEINEVLGYEDLRPLPFDVRHISVSNYILYWGVRANGRNIYRVMFDRRYCPGDKMAVVKKNDGDVVIEVQSESVTFKNAYVLLCPFCEMPSWNVSDWGVWVSQDAGLLQTAKKPIYAYTWEDMDGEYLRNPVRLIYHPSYDPEWKTYTSDWQARQPLQEAIDKLKALPEGERVVLIHSSSYTRPSGHMLDKIGEGPSLYPTLTDWELEIKNRVHDLMDKLDVKIDVVIVDFESAGTHWAAYSERFKI